MSQDEIGVPEALPRSLARLRERIGVGAIDRLWIFPPSKKGRRERGLIAVSLFHEIEGRRGLLTVTYTAEQTGKGGVVVDPSFVHEGDAPPDRFPSVMQGVVRRGGEERGEPREIEIGGSDERFEELMEEFDTVMSGAHVP
jgi:hypothetical protein